MRLSEHFTLEELTRSDTAARYGLSNEPPPAIIENLRMLAAGLEQVRALLNVPMFVSSGYRSPAVNAVVGGSSVSQHRFGLAADFRAPDFGPPDKVVAAIAASDIQFDQLIYEYEAWTHISFSHRQPRRDVLTVMFVRGRSGPYKRGLLSARQYRGF